MLAAGLPAGETAHVRELLAHFQFELHTCAWKDLLDRREELGASIVILGLGKDPLSVIPRIEGLRQTAPDSYPIVLGALPDEPTQRRILLSGAAEWLTLPLSGPFLLHACRRGLEWRHGRAVQREFEQLTGPRRRQLERPLAQIEALRQERGIQLDEALVDEKVLELEGYRDELGA